MKSELSKLEIVIEICQRTLSIIHERVPFAIAAVIVSPAIWWIGARLVPALFF